MIISATLIQNPRTQRWCDHCGGEIKGLTARFYGAANGSDQPYCVYWHAECVTDSKADPKAYELYKQINGAPDRPILTD